MNNKQILLTRAALWAAFDGFTAVYLAAYAIAQGASNMVVGLLGAMPYLAFLVTQLPGVHLATYFKRKKICAYIGIFGDLWWIGILLAPFITKNPILLIVLCYMFVRIAVGLQSPAYNTLLADMVETDQRGSFFSKRLKLIGIFGTVAVLGGGAWLKLFPKESITGFVAMFAVGTAVGIACRLIILKINEPEYRDHAHHTVSEFLSLQGDLKRFISFAVFFSFAFNIASPLIVVYILKNLGASYWFYAMIAATSTLAKVFASSKIGRVTDKYGDKPVTILGVLGTAAVPIAYLLVTPALLWLTIPISIFSGITWAAVDIARFNYLLGLTTPEKEGVQLAEYNFYVSIPLAIAPLIGGYLSEHVTLILAGVPLVLLISGILRAVSVLPILKLREPRAAREYGAFYVLTHVLHSNRGYETTASPVKKVNK
ncbi:MFS transporter [Candidatus Woesearchaeota archaeon]|nr:MFS transporter [Candidatus Woesearchaeota archaeon]